MGHLEFTDSANLILHERLPIDRHSVADYLVSLRSEGSRRVQASALKSIAKLLDMDAEEYYRCMEAKGITEERVAGRSLAIGEIRALFENCRNQKGLTGLRDGAILSLMVADGLRRSEIVGLNIADYEFSTGAITIRRGKGRKDRRVYINNGANRETTIDFATTTPISLRYKALDPFRKSPVDPG